MTLTAIVTEQKQVEVVEEEKGFDLRILRCIQDQLQQAKEKVEDELGMLKDYASLPAATQRYLTEQKLTFGEERLDFLEKAVSTVGKLYREKKSFRQVPVRGEVWVPERVLTDAGGFPHYKTSGGKHKEGITGYRTEKVVEKIPYECTGEPTVRSDLRERAIALREEIAGLDSLACGTLDPEVGRELGKRVISLFKDELKYLGELTTRVEEGLYQGPIKIEVK